MRAQLSVNDSAARITGPKLNIDNTSDHILRAAVEAAIDLLTTTSVATINETSAAFELATGNTRDAFEPLISTPPRTGIVKSFAPASVLDCVEHAVDKDSISTPAAVDSATGTQAHSTEKLSYTIPTSTEAEILDTTSIADMGDV